MVAQFLAVGGGACARWHELQPTPFSEWARDHGAAKSVMGWGMLVEQAAESFHIWRGVRPDTKPVLKQMHINA